jgi:hypothetical protein
MTAGHPRTLRDTLRCKAVKSLILGADTSPKSVRWTNCPGSVRGYGVGSAEVTYRKALTVGGHFVRTLRSNTSGGHTPPFRGVSAVRQEERRKRHEGRREWRWSPCAWPRTVWAWRDGAGLGGRND